MSNERTEAFVPWSEMEPAAAAAIPPGSAGAEPAAERATVMQIIARMNIGGPAYYVSLLCGRVNPHLYRTLLVHGKPGRDEGSFDWLAQKEGCTAASVHGLGPEMRPASDLRALTGLIRLMHRHRPRIVHTHTAKAGALGRLAAMFAPRPRPLIVHTYHGHVLEGYFGPRVSSAYLAVERALATISDCLVAVSEATVEDLVRLGVARRDAFRVLPVGLDLERFLTPPRDAGAAFRERVGARREDILVTSVGRLVPIKRIDVLLRAFARLRYEEPRARLALVGDGESRPALERLARVLGIDEVVDFVGYMNDVAPVASASDIAVLSSDNEGTPVSLIEAGAAGVPAVATAVGGVGDVVTPETGILIPAGDANALASAIERLAADGSLRARLGTSAREHVRERFGAERLVHETEALYEKLLRDAAVR